MSAIDPTKPKPLAPAFTPIEPPKPSAEAKPATNLDFVPSGPKPSYGTLFGPGVSGAVLGHNSPNVKSMSDGALVAKSRELEAAIRAKPGAVNDEDVKTLAAMQRELVDRVSVRLTPKTPPAQMTNADLAATLVALDVAKASGMPLSKEQAEWYAKANDVWKERLSVEPSKALADLEIERQKVAKEITFKCSGAVLGTAGLAPGMGLASNAATLLAVADAVRKGQWLGVAKEVTLGIGGHLKGGKIFEAISTLNTAAECKEALAQSKWIDAAARAETQKLKAQAKP